MPSLSHLKSVLVWVSPRTTGSVFSATLGHDPALSQSLSTQRRSQKLQISLVTKPAEEARAGQGRTTGTPCSCSDPRGLGSVINACHLDTASHCCDPPEEERANSTHGKEEDSVVQGRTRRAEEQCAASFACALIEVAPQLEV